jgi:hypothetical protein
MLTQLNPKCGLGRLVLLLQICRFKSSKFLAGFVANRVYSNRILPEMSCLSMKKIMFALSLVRKERFGNERQYYANSVLYL